MSIKHIVYVNFQRRRNIVLPWEECNGVMAYSPYNVKMNIILLEQWESPGKYTLTIGCTSTHDQLGQSLLLKSGNPPASHTRLLHHYSTSALWIPNHSFVTLAVFRECEVLIPSHPAAFKVGTWKSTSDFHGRNALNKVSTIDKSKKSHTDKSSIDYTY